MKRNRYHIIIAMLILASIPAGLLPGCSTSSDSGTVGVNQSGTSSDLNAATVETKYQFAALHSIDHPVISALQSKGVHVSRVSEDPEARYEALIVDGSRMTAADLSASETVRNYLKSGRGLLILNATGDHKQSLVKYVGMAYGTHDTKGYFVIPVPRSDGMEFAIYEHPSEVTFDSSGFKGSSSSNFDTAAHEAWQALARQKVDSVTGPNLLAQNIINQLEDNKARRADLKSRDSVPQGLKSCTWRVPNDTQYWGLESAWISGYPSPIWVYPAPKPAEGYQNGSFGHTTQIVLYLDNRPTNQGNNYQWLAVDFQGWNEDQKPGPNSEWESKKSHEMPMNGKKHNVIDAKNYEYKGYGWALMKYCMSFVPTDSMAGIKNYQALPETENSSTTYTSGSSFTVGFTKAGVTSGSYTVNNTVTTTQTDWKVAVLTDLSKPSYGWEWQSNNPRWDKNDAEGMNDINLNSFQPNSSAVMTTDSVISDTRSFIFTYGATLLSERAYYSDGSPKNHMKYDITPTSRNCTVTIDFSKVLYPVAGSLTLSPTSLVGGTSGSGTITIDQNAPAGGTVVSLATSNKNWATVPATVTIAEGTASVAFPITTYAVTTDSTATISATVNYVTVSDKLTVKAQ
jgi:hypothetical protein